MPRKVWTGEMDDYLREQFGVKMERVSGPITYEVLVLRPSK